MIRYLRSYWLRFCKHVVDAMKDQPYEPPPKVAWKVAWCNAYNSPPAQVVVVQASHYGEAIDLASKIPLQQWETDTSVQWSQDWAGMTAWKI